MNATVAKKAVVTAVSVLAVLWVANKFGPTRNIVQAAIR